MLPLPKSFCSLYEFNAYINLYSKSINYVTDRLQDSLFDPLKKSPYEYIYEYHIEYLRYCTLNLFLKDSLKITPEIFKGSTSDDKKKELCRIFLVFLSILERYKFEVYDHLKTLKSRTSPYEGPVENKASMFIEEITSIYSENIKDSFKQKLYILLKRNALPRTIEVHNTFIEYETNSIFKNAIDQLLEYPEDTFKNSWKGIFLCLYNLIFIYVRRNIRLIEAMDLIYYTDCDDFKIDHYNKEELRFLNSTFTSLKKDFFKKLANLLLTFNREYVSLEIIAIADGKEIKANADFNKGLSEEDYNDIFLENFGGLIWL